MLFCAIVDRWGETEADWDRHKFTWTQQDADAWEMSERLIDAQMAAFAAKWSDPFIREPERNRPNGAH